MKGPDENDRWRMGDLPPDPEADTDPVEPPPGPVPDVLEQLECYADSDRPKPTLLNVVAVLEHDPRWAGKVRRNSFSMVTEFAGTPAAEGTEAETDALDGEVALWLAEHYRLAAPTSRVAEALHIVATRHAHHPVREYLAGLKWDGEKRLGTWLSVYLGCEDCELTRRLGEAFLVSAVARVMRPGCKVDTTLILVGRQGAKKSTALRVLAGAWFADTPLNLDSKDLFEQIQGIWLYELAELDAFRGREWSKIKATLSSPRDTWRRPYGRHAVQVDRQNIFIGTTNEDNFLGDPTGSRRFWPVRVGTIDLKALMRDRDQLWAEAVASYNGGIRWWLDQKSEDELATSSEEFRIVDVWEDAVEAYLRGRVRVTLDDILGQAIKKEMGAWSQQDRSRVVGILKRLGWSQHRPRAKAGETVSKGRVWEPPPSPKEAS